MLGTGQPASGGPAAVIIVSRGRQLSLGWYAVEVEQRARAVVALDLDHLVARHLRFAEPDPTRRFDHVCQMRVHSSADHDRDPFWPSVQLDGNSGEREAPHLELIAQRVAHDLQRYDPARVLRAEGIELAGPPLPRDLAC